MHELVKFAFIYREPGKVVIFALCL